MRKSNPNLEQINALLEYARANGRTWKVQLLEDWQTGRDVSGYSYGHLLRQVRNSFGPMWLIKFKSPMPEDRRASTDAGDLKAAEHLLRRAAQYLDHPDVKAMSFVLPSGVVAQQIASFLEARKAGL